MLVRVPDGVVALVPEGVVVSVADSMHAHQGGVGVGVASLIVPQALKMLGQP